MLLVGSFYFYSCSSKEDVSQGDETQSVSFEFDAYTVVSQSKAVGDSVPVGDYTLCKSPNVPMSVSIKLNEIPTPIVLDVKMMGGVYKTDPYELPVGTYTVNSVTVFNSSSPSQVIYSGVAVGSLLSKFVPGPESGSNSYFMGEQQFSLMKYTKPTVKLYVLCAKGFTATAFGMPKFEINRIEVTCFDLFINVCNETKEHFVGEGKLQVWDKLPAQGGKLLFEDTFGDGNIATLCFADNTSISDLSEKYQIAVVFTGKPAVYQEMTVADLLKFHQWKNWNATMNAVHVNWCDDQAIFTGYPQIPD